MLKEHNRRVYDAHSGIEAESPIPRSSLRRNCKMRIGQCSSFRRLNNHQNDLNCQAYHDAPVTTVAWFSRPGANGIVLLVGCIVRFFPR